MNTHLKTPPIKFRILIVDDEPTPRQTNGFIVSDLGFEPVFALGKGEALLEDALYRAQLKRCHLALVDMVLNDEKPEDETGLHLVSNLPRHMLSFIVSGSDQGKPRTTLAALDKAINRAKGFQGYVQKGDEALSGRIQETLQRQWNWHLTYDFERAGSSPERIIARLGLSEADQVPADEVDNLLRRSYNHHEQLLSLENVEEPYELSDSTPSLRRSAVFFVEAFTKGETNQRHEIIKFAPRDHIDREFRNYRNFVRRLPHQFTALIEDRPVVSWDVGMIRYTDETTGERKRFTEWYQDSRYEEVSRAIRNLFGTALGAWYDPNLDQKGAIRRRYAVYSLYTKPSLFRKLGTQIASFPYVDNEISIPPLPGTFVNPVKWAREHSTQSRFVSRWQTLVHGDLHSGNIIVDKDTRTYIIDYERTGRSHFLRDFVELEKDIRLRLLRLDSDQLALAVHLDCVLLGQETPGILPVWREPNLPTLGESSQKELHKAFQAICAIREAAALYGGLQRLDEYYWALLMETLLTVTDPRVTGIAFQRALLSASLICKRLELWRHPQKAWPPESLCADLSAWVPASSSPVTKETTPLKSSFQHGDISASRNITILHLSDIHLGTRSQAEVYYSQLETDLLHGLECAQLDYLVLNGDMADRATGGDYVSALLLVEKVIKRFRLKRTATIIVPGNHDVDYFVSKRAYSRFVFDPMSPEDSVKRSIQQPSGWIVCDDEHLYQQRFANFAQFYESIRKQPYPLLSSEQALIWQYPKHKLLFFGLNSAAKIDHHYEQRAEINRLALANGLQKFTGKYDDWLKIAVWHHPIQGSEAMNAEFVEQLTIRGFQICMHGHIHEAIEDYHKYDNKRGVRVIGAGTFGAPVRQQTPGIPLQYNLITLSPTTCTVQVDTRKKEKPDGAWSADARWVDKVRDPQARYSFKVNWGLCVADDTE